MNLKSILNFDKPFWKSNIYNRISLTVGIVFSSIVLVHFFAISYKLVAAGLTGDATLYTAMANGMRNGLKIYVDLFETKPPLIYFIAYPFRGELLMPFQMVALFMIPILFALRKGAVGFLLGMCFILYILVRGTGYQPEGLGVIFAVIGYYVFTSQWKEYVKIPLIGLCIALTLFTKEPFLISLIGGFLLIAEKKDFKVISLSFASAFFIWLLLFLLSGALISYFTIYLPELFSGRIMKFTTYHDVGRETMFYTSASLWFRSLNMWGMLQNLPGLLPIVSIILLTQKKWWVSGIALIGIIFSLNQFYTIHQVVSIAGSIPWGDGFLQLKFAEMTVAGIVGAFALYKSPSTLRALAALYLASIAVGIGGNYYDHHFLFALPVVLSSVFLLDWKIHILLPLLVIQSFLTPDIQIPKWSNSKAKAMRVDQIMDACGYDRYFTLGAGLEGYTTHSPFQIGYGITRAFNTEFGPSNPYFKNHLERSLAETKIVVGDLPEYIAQYFTQNPPSCATSHLPIQGANVFFKK